jgi:RHS repeat-associated protein
VQADPAVTTLYLDGGAEQVIYTAAAKKTSGLRFYPAPDGTLIVRSSSGTVSYETANQQGTAQEAVSASTLAVTRRYFDPYGSPAGGSPAWPDANAFAGRPLDPATGLDLLGVRQYEAATGRFLSLDPVFQAGDPTQMGGYAYAGDNPATHADPAGLSLPGGGGGCPVDDPSFHCNPTPSPAPGPAPDPGGGGSTGGGGGTLPVAAIVADLPHARQIVIYYASQIAGLGHGYGPHVPQYLQWQALAQACGWHSGLCPSALTDSALHQASLDRYASQLATASYFTHRDNGGTGSVAAAAAFLVLALAAPEILAALLPETTTAAAAADTTATTTETGLATDSNVATVTQHLDNIGALDHPPNAAMLSRIQGAIASGRDLTSGETNFMTHELTEANLMNNGMDQDLAHELAGQTHPTFGNYDPEVIKQFPEYFNSNWRAYWGIR